MPPTDILDLTRLNVDQIVAIDPVDETVRDITITWNIGRRCNFACSYCDKDLHDKVSAHRSFDQFVKAWLRLRRVVAASGRPARMVFTGGEPTVNPDFARFVEYLSRTQRRWLFQIGMTTNGSESLAYYQKILNEMDFISFSTHFEWWDEAAFMTMLLDLWRQSGRNANGKWLHVHAMYEDWDADGVRKIREILKSEGVPQTPYKIINFYGSKGIANKQGSSFDYEAYLRERGEARDKSPSGPSRIAGDLSQDLVDQQRDPDNVDIMLRLADGTVGKSNSVQLMNFGLTNFPGWTCDVGKSLYIHNDGVVWAGNCKFRRLGNIDEDFDGLLEPVICDGRLCVCTNDIRVEKYLVPTGEVRHIEPRSRRDWYDKAPGTK